MKKIIRLTENDLTRIVRRVINEELGNNTDKNCINSANQSLVRAVAWWKNWLNHPITKQKYEKINKDQFLNGMFDHYKKQWLTLLDSIKIVVYNKNTKKIKVGSEEFVLEKEDRNANGFVMRNNPYNVYINCDGEIFNKERTIIHELQHALNQIHPLNPQEKVENLLGATSPAQTLWNNLQVYGAEYGFEFHIPSSLKKRFPMDYQWIYSNWKVKDDETYTCNWNENLSRLYSMRRLFNLSPGQDITFERIRPYIVGIKEDTNVGWFLRCWGYNGFEPIENLLQGMNSLAKNNPEPSNLV